EFNTPYLYGSEDPSKWIYPSFENNLSIWQVVHAYEARMPAAEEPVAPAPSEAPVPVEPAPSAEPAPVRSMEPSNAPDPEPSESAKPEGRVPDDALSPTDGNIVAAIGLGGGVMLTLGAATTFAVSRRRVRQ